MYFFGKIFVDQEQTEKLNPLDKYRFKTKEKGTSHNPHFNLKE